MKDVKDIQNDSIEFSENNQEISREPESGDITPATQQEEFPGYEPYPASEDAYNAAEIVPLMEEGDAFTGETNPDAWNETSDLTGDDLDVPGAELDDDMEDIGNEDEENNYYSLGGDKDDILESPDIE